jgi:hypothetical protein
MYWDGLSESVKRMPELIGISASELLFDTDSQLFEQYPPETFQLYFRVMGKWRTYNVKLHPQAGSSTQNSMPFEVEGNRISELRRDLLMARRSS